MPKRYHWVFELTVTQACANLCPWIPSIWFLTLYSTLFLCKWGEHRKFLLILDLCFLLNRGHSWNASRMSASLTVSTELVLLCWKGKASALTVERRPARPRKSPSPRLTPPPLCPPHSHSDLLWPGSPRAEQTPPLAGKLPAGIWECAGH